MDEKTPTEKQESPKPKGTPTKEKKTPEAEITNMTDLAAMEKAIKSIEEIISQHSQRLAELETGALRKRKPTRNGKIQIRDKKTGTVYPSKNNAYQSLLKAGELKELVDKGIFGSEPEKNNFGWFALVRAWPDRFEEVKVEDTTV